MCKAWDDHKKSGIREGRREGRKERKEGILESRLDSIRSLMGNLSVTMEEAMDLLAIPKKDRESCIKGMQVTG